MENLEKITTDNVQTWLQEERKIYGIKLIT